MRDKWDFQMDEKTLNIYRNLSNQIEKVFSHTRQGSIKTRYRYKDGVNHFAKFVAEAFKKQNLNKIETKHLEAYVEQMKECGYSKSYLTMRYLSMQQKWCFQRLMSYKRSLKNLKIYLMKTKESFLLHLK